MASRKKTVFPGHPLYDTAALLSGQLMSLADYPSLRRFLSEQPDGAMEDWLAVGRFLDRYATSPGSYARFRGEAQRLLNYLWVIKQKPLTQANGDDLSDYLNWVKTPPLEWITKDSAEDPVESGERKTGSGRQRSFVDRDGLRMANEHWRPFVGEAIKRKKASLKAYYATLSVMFKRLLIAGYIDKSPLLDIDRRAAKAQTGRKNGANRPARAPRLTQWQWIYLHDCLIDAAKENPDYERHLFLVVTMKTLYLRVFELAPHGRRADDGDFEHEPVMGDFSVTTKENERYWHLYIHGKGDEERYIPLPDDYVERYLKRYRHWRKLSPLPGKNENTPIMTTKTGKPIRSKRTLENMINESMMLAVNQLNAQGMPDAAAEMAQFAGTTHILRHTGASMDLDNGRPLKDVSEDLGHHSPSFTEAMYYHADEARRYRSGRLRSVV